MIKVNCEACDAPYEVDPRRIPASGLKMRCPACGASVHVKPPGAPGDEIDLPAAKGSSLDLDLPAPKAAAPKKHKGTQVGLGMPTLDAPVPAAPKAAAAPSLDLADLPAPKAAAPKAAAPKLAPAFDDLDLPAPKHDLDLPAVKGPAAPRIAPSLTDDLTDLPAPRAAAPKPMGDLTDLPAPRGAPNLSADLTDLPAPRGAVSSLTDDLTDLPAPRAAQPTARLAPAFAEPAPSPFGDDHADLPAPKAVPAGGRSTQKLGGAVPAAKVAPAPAKSEKLAKDSLAIDPEPFFAALKKSGGSLEDLDDLSLGQPPEMELEDLPAPKAKSAGDALVDKAKATFGAPAVSFNEKPSPVAKPAPQGTKMGLGLALGGAKLPKDSLDLPSALAAAQRLDSPEPFGASDAELPAPADLPQIKAAKPAKPAKPAPAAPILIGEIDLPAPHDLPVAKPKGASAPKAAGKPAQPPTAMGIGPLTTPRDSLDLPAPADLPQIKGFNEGSGTEMGLGGVVEGLDLPAPADLPQIKGFNEGSGTEMGLGGVAQGLDLPAPADLPQVRGGGDAFGLSMGDGFDLPPANDANPMAGLDLDRDFGQSFGSTAARGLGTGFGSNAALDALDRSLDLPPSGGGQGPTDHTSSLIDLSKLALPTVETHQQPRGGNMFGSTMDLAADDLDLSGADRSSAVLPLPSVGDRGSLAMALPSLGDTSGFGEFGTSPRGQTMELDGMFELGGSVAHEQSGFGSTSGGGGAFGELDFGLGAPQAAPAPAPMPMPVPIPQHGGGFDSRSVEDELLGGDEKPLAPVAPKKKKRKLPSVGGISIPGWVWAVSALVLIAGGGAFLGLMTPHGYFGVYFVEQLLPAAGDPIKVAAAIQLAEKQAITDTYVDVRKSLATLSDARNEAGLNRVLLPRSLMHEALYQLRFGEDPQSAQRSVAILSRVMERGAEAPGLTLARAAHAARAGNIPEAVALLKKANKDKDPYRALVIGEIALLQQRYADAAKAFADAERYGGGARASWGSARALTGLDKQAEAEVAVTNTLKASPRHSAALARMAEIMLLRGKPAEAIVYTRKATGHSPVDGIRARPSRNDRAVAWALEGEIQEELEQPREALAAYEQALAADPLRVSVLLGSGRMLMRLARPRDALARFDSASNAKPSDKPDLMKRIPLVEATVGSAQALLALERPQEALGRIQPLLVKFKSHPDLVLWLGHAQQALEKNDLAEEAFRKVIELSPNAFAGYVALSQLLFKSDRPEEAARTLSEATGKVEDSAEVRRMLGYSELNRNHLPEAVHHFEASLRFDPRDSAALFGLANSLRKMGELDKAQTSLDRLEQLDAGHPGLPLERGQLCEARGDYAAAVAAYRKALTDRPNDTDLKLRLGAALVTAGSIDEADAILKEVLRDRPSSAEAEHYIGRVLFARNDTAQAVQRFERAVSFEPLRADFHLFLAWAALEQGNLSGALESVNKSIERDPNLGDAYWILGRVELRTGAVKDALDHFQRALKLKPGRHEALANMGDAYDQLRQLPEAVAAYNDAVKAVPENGEWWYRLGSLELDRGNRAQSRVALSEAVMRGDRFFKKPGWVSEAHRLYADVLREDKREGEALEHYRMYLSLAPANARDRAEIEQIVKSMSMH